MRHGQAMYEAGCARGVPSSMEDHDARLSVLGAEQSQALADRFVSLEMERAAGVERRSSLARDVFEGRGLPSSCLDLVLTSPLTRCVQTALKVFAPVLAQNRELVTLVPCLAIEELRELVSSSPHSARRSREELDGEFRGEVDFSMISDEPRDAAWQVGVPRETLSASLERFRKTLLMVFSSDEPFCSAREIALVSHPGILYLCANVGHGVQEGNVAGLFPDGSLGAEPVFVYSESCPDTCSQNGPDTALERWFRSRWKPGELRSVVLEKIST